MLEFFRTHVGGLFGIALVVLLAAAFALSFGTQSKGWGEGESIKYAAEINGVKIPEMTLRYAVNLRGGRANLSSDDPALQRMEQIALEGLIERQLLIDMAQQTGISASTQEAEERVVNDKIFLSKSIEELMQMVKNYPFLDPGTVGRILVKDGHQQRQGFKDDQGKFDLESYRKFVQFFLQVTEEVFIEQQRLELIAERMRQLIASTVRVSKEEVRDLYDRENNTAKIDYIRLMPNYFSQQLDPSPAELTAWAGTHADEVKQYYETNKFRYTNLEKQARARHILIKVDEKANDAEKGLARVKIESLLKRARAGEDFATLARENSEDPGSGKKGGDLGFNPRGKMVPEFDEVMFAATPGEISDVVETKYGFHIIRVEEFREGNITLEQATPEIADVLYRRIEGEQRAEAAAKEMLAKLKAGTKMADLLADYKEDKSSSYLTPKVRSSRPFSRSTNSIPGLGEAPDIVAAAFDLSMDKPVPDKTFAVRNDHLVMQLVERNEPSDEEFEKLKDNLSESLLAFKQGAWLRERMAEWKKDAETNGQIVRLMTGTAPQPTTAAPSAPMPDPASAPAAPATPAPPKPAPEGATSPATPAPVPAPTPSAPKTADAPIGDLPDLPDDPEEEAEDVE